MSQELSDEYIGSLLSAHAWCLFAGREYEAYTGQERLVVEGVADFARAVIAADRAKRVTMTHAQRVDVLAEFGAGDMWDFFDGIRAAEAFHGIGSKT